MRVGMSRRDAYRALAARTDVPDLRAFVRAVVQADTYGISVSTVLRTQAKEMRMKRRQRAEEKAMQIPVKVLFPLMLFILPVLFIAVLGPTVLHVVASFSCPPAGRRDAGNAKAPAGAGAFAFYGAPKGIRTPDLLFRRQT